MDQKREKIIGEIAALTQMFGRKPRILHIGNIANNAYNNAKLLNKLGFENDVICYDYYHIMGCPEWEDAEFENTLDDDFHPDWTKVDVNGFKRPDWFAQGPLDLCVAYLIARRTGRKRLARVLWKELAICNKTERARRGFPLDLTYLNPNFWLVFVNHKLIKLWRYFAYELSRKCRAALNSKSHEHRAMGRFLASAKRLVRKTQLHILEFILFTVWVLRLVASKIRNAFHGKTTTRDAMAIGSDEHAKHICKEFTNAFPERDSKLEPHELKPYFSTIPYWVNLFSHYDLVIGYATDPILPYLVGKPYFALEHGTLREIPFEENTRGKLTALAYNRANHVFVTNFDCLANAEILAGDKHRFINHPYDEDRNLNRNAEDLRQELQKELDAEFLVFFPTRQDWVVGTGYADKANDIFLRAFCRLRNEGKRIGMIACDWGKNVEESKTLLREYGCGDYVKWIAPMALRKFEKVCSSTDLVADQFMLGAFGGVMFKSLAAGVPVCTYLNEAMLEGLYEEMPPALNCKTEDEIHTCLATLMDSNEELEKIRKASRDWVEVHHSGNDLAEMQAQLFLSTLRESFVGFEK